MREFISVVDEAYRQFDDDRAMLERSLEMSSQELLQANSDMRAIFQVLPDLFFRLDSDGTILDYKAGGETDFYSDPKLLMGKRIQDIPVAEVSKAFAEAIEKMREAKSQISVEYSLPTDNGRVYYEARFLPLPGNEMIIIIRDITAGKKAEKELRSREELLSATLESTADGILVVDETGVVTHANSRFAEMWRIPQELLNTHDDSKLLNHVLDQLKDPSVFLSKVQELYHHSQASFDTLYFKDGRIFERFAFPLNKEGKIAGRVWSFRDVTERKVAEGRVACLNQLKEKLLGPGELSDKLRHITDTVVEVLHADFARIWVAKPSDSCESGCPHASATLGPRVCTYREQCLHLIASSGRYTHVDGTDHRRVPFAGCKIGRIATGEEPGFLTNDLTGDDRLTNREWAESLGLVAFAGQRVVSTDSEPIGVLAYFSQKPITEDEFAFSEVLAGTASQVIQTAVAEDQRRSLQDKLDRAERMESLGILAGGVAHDLNNMLGPLVGYPELILSQLPAESPVRRQVQRVGEAARNAADVIQDLLTLARRGRYELEPLNLNAVVRTYLDSPSFTRLSERCPGVKVDTKLSDSLPFIAGSSVHLSKVIMNLIVNAFDAMQSGGTVLVETLKDNITRLRNGYSQIRAGDYVLLRVCDTGIGIAEEDKSRIFEPYYSKKRMGSSGSGLGLSVVYGVVKDHKGYYDITSEVGKGTEFILYFPVCGEKPSTPVSKSNLKGGTETILVIDDSPEQRELATDVLSGLGYSVTATENGTQGIRYLQDNQVDLVVIDMVMEPGLDGLDTYSEIVKLHPGQKAVIVSGFAATDRVEKAQKLGAGQYVRKPYTVGAIATAVRQELDKVPAAASSSS